MWHRGTGRGAGRRAWPGPAGGGQPGWWSSASRRTAWSFRRGRRSRRTPARHLRRRGRSCTPRHRCRGGEAMWSCWALPGSGHTSLWFAGGRGCSPPCRLPCSEPCAVKSRQVKTWAVSPGASAPSPDPGRDSVSLVRVDLLTREYPPHVYGGAGVHVTELAAVLRRHVDVRVRCFDGPRDDVGVTGYDIPAGLADQNAALRTLGVDLLMAGDTVGADVVHSHTWYANLAGHVGALLHGVPHVVTAHSLEPLRPWKAEQLGGGYALSGWAESTAYEHAQAVIAVSAGMRADILRVYPRVDPERVKVVHNGIDLAGWRRPEGEDRTRADQVVRGLGIDPDRPAVVFVGRITRQKGLPYLLRAAERLPEDVQLVLCAGAPDTPEIAAQVAGLVADLRATRGGVVWIEQMLPRQDLVAVLSAGTVVYTSPSPRDRTRSRMPSS